MTTTQKQTREQLTQNWIDRTLNYYDSDDFKNMYAENLLEDSHNCIDNIMRVSSLCFNLELNREQARQIFEEIQYNFPELDTFNGYYVGDNCIDSVSFGEQETELPTDFLPVTELMTDFYLSRGYAYYVVSGGVMIKLTEHMIIDAFKN